MQDLKPKLNASTMFVCFQLLLLFMVMWFWTIAILFGSLKQLKMKWEWWILPLFV